MNTTEGNKLIAEFMGFKIEQGLYIVDLGEVEEDYYSPMFMRFHKSWDWLMPVVGKIFDKWNQETYFYEGHLYDDIIDSLKMVKTNLVHKSVIKFIEWHNENK